MSRTRMSWDWIGNQPIFIYTTWITHNEFYVKIVKGKYGDQNASGYGPRAETWHDYVSQGLASKNEVVQEALVIAKFKLALDNVLEEY